jgi:hypothetical protein
MGIFSFMNFRKHKIAMRRNFYKKVLCVLLLLGVVQVAAAKFELVNWYSLGSYEIEPVDECEMVHKVVCHFTQWSPGQFAIYEDGKNLTRKDLDFSSHSRFGFHGIGNDGVTEGFSITANISSEGWDEVFYINTRVYPYQILTSEPVGEFSAMKISPSESELTEPSQPFAIEGIGCSSNPDAVFAYTWYKSSNGTDWEEIPGQTTANMPSVTQEEDVTYYKAEARVMFEDADGVLVDTLVTSNVVTMRYKQPVMDFTAALVNGKNGTAFNATEFEVSEGGILKFTPTATGFSGTPTYKLQYRPLEGTALSEEWLDWTSVKLDSVVPPVSAEYRLAVTGTSLYSGREVTVSANTIIGVRKIYVVDREKYEVTTLWSDDFGKFLSSTEYVDGKGESYKDQIGDEVVSHFWASDPHGYVKEHQYATKWPGHGSPTDWHDGWRLEDGYYIITSNPRKGDGKSNDFDYWDAEDHTAGDTDGAMLFVNCGSNPGAVIYERPITLDCDVSSAGIWMYFSSNVANAVCKEVSNTPVDVRWELLDEGGSVVYTSCSGDVNRRSASLKEKDWANVSFRFLAKSKNYTLRLYNNALGGANWGNDILVDDISVILCYPKIDIQVGGNSVVACAGEQAKLITYNFDNESGIDYYIENPFYQFQYRKVGADGWKNLGKMLKKNDPTLLDTTLVDSLTIPDVKRNVLARYVNVEVGDSLQGPMEFRVIVAGNDSTLDSIASGFDIKLSCSKIYAISDAVKLNLSKPYDLKLTLSDTVFCLGTVSAKASAVAIDFNAIDFKSAKSDMLNTRYFWYIGEELIDSTTESSYTLEEKEGLFDEVGSYVLRVRSLDDMCQKNLSIQNSDSSKAEFKVEARTKLGLELASGDSKVSFGESVDFNIDNDGYTEKLIWNEVVLVGTPKEPAEIENSESYTVDAVEYDVCYFVSAEGACVDPSDTICVETDLVIPNLITPSDGNGKNDTFLKGTGISVQIFNRYSALIYEGNDGWDAIFKEEVAEPGTYYYIITFKNGEQRKGTLEVAKFKK